MYNPKVLRNLYVDLECTQVDFGEVPNAKCSNPTLDKLSKISKKENTAISDNVLSTHP